MKPVNVTYSELTSYRSCRQRWWFAYHQLLRPQAVARPLRAGSCLHAGLGEMYRFVQKVQLTGGEPDELEAYSAAKQALDLKHEQFEKETEQIRKRLGTERYDQLMEEGEKAYKESREALWMYADSLLAGDIQRYHVKAVEFPVSVRLPDRNGGLRGHHLYEGVIDLVLYDPELNDLVVAEHKSTSSDARLAERKLDMEVQTTGYLWALKELMARGKLPAMQPTGTPNTGRCFYNVVRKKLPSEPQFNKDGTVSAAAIETTREKYEAALLKQERIGKRRTDKQQAILDGLPKGVERWISRFEFWHSQDMVDRWLRELRYDASEIGKLRRLCDKTQAAEQANGHAAPPPPAITRNTEHCNPPWMPACPYRSICIDDDSGRRASDYRRATDAHEEVVEAQEPPPDANPYSHTGRGLPW